MPRVRCAICNKELSVQNAKRCNNCEIWLCKNHVEYPLINKPKCPKCKKEVK